MAATLYTDCGAMRSTFDHSYCIADGGRCRGNTMTNHSVCLEKGSASCYSGTYENYSVCKGKGSVPPPISCAWNYYSNHSVCFGDGDWACKGNGNSEKSDYDNYSSCVGNKYNTCQNTNFTNYSVCFANASGACAHANYDDTSCCQGEFCTEHQCDSKPLTKNLVITQPVYEEMITPIQ